MKKSIKIIIPLVILIPIIVLLYFYLFDSSTHNSFKNTKDNYEYTILRDNGWIPTIIPNDATDIEIFHNIDTNIVNGKFKLENETSLNNFKSLLSPSGNQNFNFLNNSYKNKILKIIKENPTFKYEDFYFVFDNNTVYFLKVN